MDSLQQSQNLNIKAITTSPILNKDNRAFVVFTSPSDIDVKAARLFNPIVTNLETYEAYSAVLEKPCHLVLCSPNDDDLKRISKQTNLQTYFKNVSIYVLDNTVSNNITNVNSLFQTIQRNVIMLNRIHEYFQYLSPWKGTLIDCVLILSVIHSMPVLYTNLEASDVELRDSKQVIKPLQPPQEFWMFTQFYKPKEKARELEINDTLRRNVDCDFIDRICIFLEKKEHEQDVKRILAKKSRSAVAKVHFIPLLRRLAYSDFLSYVSSSEVPENTYVALTNSDIYFDDTIGNIWSVNMKDKLMALLRYEHSDDGPQRARIFGPRPDSQDTWIFDSSSIKARNFTSESLEKYNYCLGMPGCDNSFTTDMVREKFLTANPAGTIRTYHHHQSQIRNYSREDLIYRPVYFHVNPTILTEVEQKKVPDKKALKLKTSNEIIIKSNTNARAETYCTMLARGNVYKWSFENPNLVNEQFSIYEYNNTCFSPTGLPYNSFSIYIGNTNKGETYWRNSNLNQLATTIKVSNFIAVPIESDSIYTNVNIFVLNYVLPFMRIINEIPKIDNPLKEKYTVFWPQQFTYLLNFIDLPIRIELVNTNANQNVYTERGISYGVGSVIQCKEQIQTLNEIWKPLKNNRESENTFTLISNDGIFNVNDEKFIGDLTKLVEKYGWELNIVSENMEGVALYSKLYESNGLLFWNEPGVSKAWMGAWNLPKGAPFLEVQNEFKLSGEAQELAGACELDARIYILQKADTKYLQGLVLKYVEGYLMEHPCKVTEPEPEPQPTNEISMSLSV